MIRRKRELAVPIRDRRQHVRILTLKNFARVAGVLVLAFLTINIISEIRAPHAEGYGRLFNRQRPVDEITSKPAPQVVHEAPVPDTERADATLMAPMARAQYLGETPLAPAAIAAPATAEVIPSPARQQGKIEIVGGADGVSIVHNSQQAAPKLSGGIFRQ